MKIITLDFETYYDSDYTLKKMTTEAYIRDPRFQALLCAVKVDDKPAEWLTAQQLYMHVLLDYNIDENAVLCHHAQFDGLILSHHFGLKPKRWLCTLSMARYLHGSSARLSLEAQAERYELRAKTVDYESFKGRRLENMDAATLARLGAGAARDADSTYDLFVQLATEFPSVEYRTIDTTVRMFTEPRLVGDVGLLADIRDREFLSKNERLYELGVGEKDLSSATKFCALLEAEGVDIEYKEGSAIDPQTGRPNQIPAIAKTDSFMRSLLDSDDERISALAEARLDVKSTLQETRAGRLHNMAQRGALAVYLYAYGAHTRRWSGGDATNFQNLNRGSRLRAGICAPEGFLIAAPDQSQGECRFLNWLAGQEDVLERFRNGHDPYCPIASKFYGREITAANPTERGTGKQLELSCGFGCGPLKFKITAARGTYGPPVDMTLLQAEDAVRLYREEHKCVVNLWAQGGWCIERLAAGDHFKWKIFEGFKGRLYHSNGTWLDYSRLKWDGEAQEWRLMGRNGSWVKIYGSKFVENVIQWLSRIQTAEAMVRFEDAGYPVVGMAHDDVWLLVPLYDDAKEPGHVTHKQKIIEMMRQPPTWAPDIPLDADCKMGRTYS